MGIPDRILNKTSLLLSILLVSFSCSGQFTTVANGAWFSPITWGGTPPGISDSVVINHNVTLAVDWGLSIGGSLTINSGASLSENLPGKVFYQTGGSFINNGTFDFPNLWVDSGSVINNDSMHILTGLYNGSIFTNNGSIEDVDSIWNDGTWVNGLDGLLTGALLYNTDSLFNNGVVGVGSVINEGSVLNIGFMVSSIFYTQGDFENGVGGAISTTDFWNANEFINDGGAGLNVTADFLNADSNFFGLNATFYNDGFVGVGNNWYNAGNIDGFSGQFCINAFSANTGVITGAIDICDNTPTTSTLDIPGTIGGFVTFCTGPCNMVVSSSINEVTCNGNCDGSIALIAYGGTQPYTYLWESGNTADSLGNLCEDFYVVQVNDAAGDSILVFVNLYTPPLSLTQTTTEESCANVNGTASVTVSEGTAPYIYAWNDPNAQTTALATGLAAGSYSITIIDIDSCSITDVLLVSAKPVMSVNTTITPVTCLKDSNGIIDMAVTGGTLPYDYLWSPDISTGPLAAGVKGGEYNITITDADTCQVFVNVSVPVEGGLECFDWKIFSGLTPNGDGVDDYWEIRGLEQFQPVTVQIFTNRGVVVWSSDNYKNEWKGTDQDGEPLVEGVYYYLVTRPDKEERGWVHIVR